MSDSNWILLFGGLISGLLAGLLGIGGGTMLVPLLVALHYSPLNAVATSSLSVLITSLSGSLQNWRMGYFDRNRVLGLGFPALVTSQLGVYLASRFSAALLLYGFGLLLMVNLFLIRLRQRLEKQANANSSPSPLSSPSPPSPPSFLSSPLSPSPQFLTLARIGTGGMAGLLAGLFGVGGGVIMVPLQMLLLGEPIKVAIQTSLGVIIITAIAAVLGHTVQGNVLYYPGFLLGIGGLVGAQISTRYLPKLPNKLIVFSFNGLLIILAIYTFWQAWQRSQ
jgi:uncharacterized membrane protein YfcA